VSVLDASLAVDLVLGRPRGEGWHEWVAEANLAAPDHLVAECGQVLRRLVLHAGLDAERALLGLDTLLALPIAFYPTSLFAQEAFTLRDNFTFDDALYVVMAQRLGEDLASTDERLTAATRQFTAVPLAAPA